MASDSAPGPARRAYVESIEYLHSRFPAEYRQIVDTQFRMATKTALTPLVTDPEARNALRERLERADQAASHVSVDIARLDPALKEKYERLGAPFSLPGSNEDIVRLVEEFGRAFQGTSFWLTYYPDEHGVGAQRPATYNESQESQAETPVITTKRIARRDEPLSPAAQWTPFTPAEAMEIERIHERILNSEEGAFLHVKSPHVRMRDARRLHDDLLNDELINAYFELLFNTRQNQCRWNWVSTFFATQPKDRPDDVNLLKTLFTGKIKHDRRFLNVFDEFDKVLVPFNYDNTHWVLIVLDFKHKHVLALDSMRTSTNALHDLLFEPLCDFLSEIQNDMRTIETYGSKSKRPVSNPYYNNATRVQRPFVISEWSWTDVDVPQQGDLKACGVFVCLCARAVVQSDAMVPASLPFEHAQIAFFRQMLTYELANGALRAGPI